METSRWGRGAGMGAEIPPEEQAPLPQGGEQVPYTLWRWNNPTQEGEAPDGEGGGRRHVTQGGGRGTPQRDRAQGRGAGPTCSRG